MIYRSNLTAPDLTPLFADILLDPPMQIMGHDAPSHKDFGPACGFWTHDEGAILYTIAATVRSFVVAPIMVWVDIGSRFGWTSHHVAAVKKTFVYMVDPLYQIEEMYRAASQIMPENATLYALTAKKWFRHEDVFQVRAQGFVIDGNHDSPEPLLDAEGALNACRNIQDCVIIFHDFYGAPIQEGVRYLMFNGFKCRIYWTPNGVACCWRGFEGWEPPVHRRDPAIEWLGHMHAVKQGFKLADCV